MQSVYYVLGTGLGAGNVLVNKKAALFSQSAKGWDRTSTHNRHTV